MKQGSSAQSVAVLAAWRTQRVWGKNRDPTCQICPLVPAVALQE